MTDVPLTILPEAEADALPIVRLHARTLARGSSARTAFRTREPMAHALALPCPAPIGTLLAGSAPQTPVCIGDAPALFLGPVTAAPPFRGRGIGQALVARALK